MLSKNQIKQLTSLHLKKSRQEQKLFIVEGKKIIHEVLKSSLCIQQLFATKLAITDFAQNKTANNCNIIEVNEEELGKISMLSSPNYALAICKTPELNINFDLLNSSTTLYLDDIRDPGNLGTIIRVADWFGVKQIICSPLTTELFNPKTIQSTMGSFLRVAVVYSELEDVLNKMVELKIHIPIYGAMLEGENIYSQRELTKGIIVIGNESNGISANIKAMVSHKIKIPSASNNGAESLNAAIASSLILGEFFRREL